MDKVGSRFLDVWKADIIDQIRNAGLTWKIGVRLQKREQRRYQRALFLGMISECRKEGKDTGQCWIFSLVN